MRAKLERRTDDRCRNQLTLDDRGVCRKRRRGDGFPIFERRTERINSGRRPSSTWSSSIRRLVPNTNSAGTPAGPPLLAAARLHPFTPAGPVRRRRAFHAPSSPTASCLADLSIRTTLRDATRAAAAVNRYDAFDREPVTSICGDCYSGHIEKLTDGIVFAHALRFNASRFWPSIAKSVAVWTAVASVDEPSAQGLLTGRGHPPSFLSAVPIDTRNARIVRGGTAP